MADSGLVVKPPSPGKMTVSCSKSSSVMALPTSMFILNGLWLLVLGCGSSWWQQKTKTQNKKPKVDFILKVFVSLFSQTVGFERLVCCRTKIRIKV
jgi:hypothetical protein